MAQWDRGDSAAMPLFGKEPVEARILMGSSNGGDGKPQAMEQDGSGFPIAQVRRQNNGAAPIPSSSKQVFVPMEFYLRVLDAMKIEKFDEISSEVAEHFPGDG